MTKQEENNVLAGIQATLEEMKGNDDDILFLESRNNTQIASIAAMMAVANGDEVYDLPRNNSPKNTLSKGKKKKCKSCRHFPCPESKEPMRVACGNHERRKKK